MTPGRSEVEVRRVDPRRAANRRLLLAVRGEVRRDEEFDRPFGGTRRRDQREDERRILATPGVEAGRALFVLGHFRGRPAGRMGFHPGDEDAPSSWRLALFECRNDRRLFDALLHEALPVLRDRGATTISGPHGLDPHGEVGCLITPPTAPPPAGLPHHPRFYGSLFEGYGFTPRSESHCYLTGRDHLQAHPLFNRLLGAGGREDPAVVVRPLLLTPEDLDLCSSLLAASVAAGTGFGLPPGGAIGELLQTEPGEPSELCLVLENHGRPAGCVIAISTPPPSGRRGHGPWYRRLLPRHRDHQGKPRLRIAALGLLPSAASLSGTGCLVRDLLMRALDRSLEEVEIGCVPGTSREFSRNLGRLIGITDPSRTYRMFTLDLGAPARA